MDKKLITLYLFLGFIIDILIITLSIKFNIIFLIIISMILFTVLLILLICSLIETIKDSRFNNSIKRNKKIKSNYSNLYVSLFDGNKKHNFIKELKAKKLGLSDIEFKLNVNRITFTYKYLGFLVYIDIYNNYIKCKVYTAMKYSLGKLTKIYNKKELINDDKINIEYLSFIAIKRNSYIDDYINNHNVDDFYNGKVFFKYDIFKKYIIEDAAISLIFGTLLITTFILGGIEILKSGFNKLKLFSKIPSLLLIMILGLSIILIRLGLKNIIRYKNLLKDFKNVETFDISGKVNKVKISFRSTRYSYDVKYIKVYIKKHCIFIAFPQYFWIKSKNNLKACINELLNSNCNFTVLKRSMVVVKGEQKFVNIAKSYLK